MQHPCLSCGACCAHYRVSLHWSEAEPDLGGRVPVALTETFGPHQRCMRGTWAERPHCVALQGTVGASVSCSIYDARPGTCYLIRPDQHVAARWRRFDVTAVRAALARATARTAPAPVAA